MADCGSELQILDYAILSNLVNSVWLFEHTRNFLSGKNARFVHFQKLFMFSTNRRIGIDKETCSTNYFPKQFLESFLETSHSRNTFNMFLEFQKNRSSAKSESNTKIEGFFELFTVYISSRKQYPSI